MARQSELFNKRMTAMRTFDDLSIHEREAYIAEGQRYLRGEIPEFKIPAVTRECHNELLVWLVLELDRDWLVDRLSFVRSGL